MAINIEILKKEIENQIGRWEHLKNPFTAQMGGNVVDSILADEELMQLYNKTDTTEMIVEYSSKVERIKQSITSPNNTNQQNILNILEYLRCMHSFENIKDNGVVPVVASLSQSSISQLTLGKGVCASQAKLMRDLLPIEAEVLTVDFRDKDEPMLITEQHDVVIVNLDGKLSYLDPTWYNGDSTSLEGSKNVAHYGNYTFESINATEEEISKSRKEIQNMLIEKLKIGEISNQLINSNMSDLQKQCAIFTFIESRINYSNTDVDFSTAKLFDNNVEVGKLMELFFVANNMECELQNHGDKSNTIYKTNLNGEKMDLYPKYMFDSKRENGKYLLQSLHFAKDKNGKSEYVCKRSSEMMAAYKEAIVSGRDRVANLNLDNIDKTDEIQR